MFLKTWSESGTPAGPACCAVTMVPSQHAAASAAAPRTTNLLPTAHCRLPTGLLLHRLRRVGTTRAEQRFHVALLHDGLERATALDDLSCEAFENDGVAGLEIVRPPALAANGVRARELHVPVRHLAVFVFHVDVHAHVRIRPRDHGDDAFEFYVLAGVVLGVKPVVRKNRGRDGHNRERRDQDAELSHFRNLQMIAWADLKVGRPLRPCSYFRPSVPLPTSICAARPYSLSSRQMNSIRSALPSRSGRNRRPVKCSFTGRVSAPGSSRVKSFSMRPQLVRVQRSTVWSCSVCGVPRLSNQNLSL